MDKLTTYAPLIARILIGILFLAAGAGKLGDVAGFTGYLTSGGLPAFLAWPSILFEIVLGLAIIAGYQVRVMALLGVQSDLTAELGRVFGPLARQMAGPVAGLSQAVQPDWQHELGWLTDVVERRQPFAAVIHCLCSPP